jgi:hypothetical protein
MIRSQKGCGKKVATLNKVWIGSGEFEVANKRSEDKAATAAEVAAAAADTSVMTCAGNSWSLVLE